MTDHLAALAINVRRLRETRGLSLAQLGEQAGIAKATLFKIEQERTNPTLETMVAIADTFDVPLTELLTPAEAATIEVIRAGEGKDISDDASVGSVLRQQVIGAGTLEIHAQRFLKGKLEVSPSHGPGVREHVLVHSGRIEIGPVDKEVVLDEGDYATFLADQPHRWHAVDGDASIWIMAIYPRAATFNET
ncbi:XRE family transcriptional regulator [Streptomyces sp. NPDC006872]|uniref:helix-turn-helix domain-containing protein n=1 Tax=Streptomyces sp. NPDC006872 TaxID=3155720 RepID=UPI00340DB794